MNVSGYLRARWLPVGALAGIALLIVAAFFFTGATAAPLLAPTAPSGLAATAGQTYVSLYWTDKSSDEDGFRVYRSIDQEVWQLAGEVASPTVSYADLYRNCNTTYYYRVTAYNSSGESAPSGVKGVTTSVCTLFSPPSNLQAEAPTGIQTQINLSWQDNTSRETGFRVERWPDVNLLETWGTLATVAQDVTSYNNTGLTAGTVYTYRVRAIAMNEATEPSNVVSATTNSTGIAPPGAPGDLHATSVAQTQIDMAWTDNAANEDGFYVERNPNSGGGASWGQIATVGQDVTAYSNTGLSCGTTYNYRVRAYNGGGTSAYSNEMATDTTACTVPAAPTGLTATGASDTEMDLAWTDNSTDEWGFNVERAPDGTTFSNIYTSGANATSYHDSGLTCETVYWYRANAFNGAGTSAYSNTATDTTGACPTTPPDPATSLRGWPISKTEIGLSWTAPVTGTVSTYIISRSDYGSTSFTQVATTTGSTTVYTDTGLSCGSAYNYQVVASNANGDSSAATVNNVPTLVCAMPGSDQAPSSVGAKGDGAEIEISVWWVDRSINESGFLVERSSDGTSWKGLGPTQPNFISYRDQDTQLQCGVTYTYQVRACYGTDCSEGVSAPTSNQAAVSTTCPVSGLSGAWIAGASASGISSSSDGYVKLVWIDNSVNEEEIWVERAPLYSSNWSKVATVTPNSTAYNDFSVNADVTYQYRVLSINGDYPDAGYAAYSDVVLVTTGTGSANGSLYLPMVVR